MNLPVISLIALVIAILISCFTRLNAGLLSIAFAFIIGVLLKGLKLQEVVGGFPAGLFLTLIGVTLLFAQAQTNGTLDKVAKRAIHLARGNAGLIPIIFFVLALVVSGIGPGNIAAVALLAPVAMVVAGRAGISAFLMAIMICNGAGAGSLSPFAPGGVIANGLMAKAGMPDAAWPNFYNTLLAQSVVAFAGYFALGGIKLFRRRPSAEMVEELKLQVEPFDARQKFTLAIIAALVVSVVGLKLDVTIGAFIGAALLSATRSADEEKSIKAIPWNAVLMVCGVTVLVAMLEKTGGMDLFTTLLAKLASQRSVTGVIAFVTGLVSVYSSSTGVVLPAFLPTIPGLIEKLGGGDALAIAYSINVGTHLVDVSPLSTLGALCIANAAESEDRTKLFYWMLAWGLSMALVGAVVCFVFFGLLR
ncbi:MAG: C4-dicarboxylate ABC transporter [Acidobacteria bacterium]|nr:C4-dicarboxylate ABC transporter [Acidobacteriota bacterium]